MNVVIPEEYRQQRLNVPFETVSIGFSSLSLASVEDLDAAQLGYGVVPHGHKNDWEPEWVVIGHEGRLGDPIFIDTSRDSFAVYTAAHGMGAWEPEQIADSFQSFVQILIQLQALARGRDNPILMKRNPLKESEREAFLEYVEQNNPDLDSDFWDQVVENV